MKIEYKDIFDKDLSKIRDNILIKKIFENIGIIKKSYEIIWF